MKERRMNRMMTSDAKNHPRGLRYNTVIPWLILIGSVLVVFALGALAGYCLPRRESAACTKKTTAAQLVVAATGQPAKLVKLAGATKGVPEVPLDYDLQQVMYESCRKYDVPFALALAVAEKESNFDLNAVSRTDDHGIMQINRCNFAYLRGKGLDPLTCAGNIEGGVMLLGENLALYGDENQAVMAYNCGRAGAQRLWDAGTYSTEYSRSVMDLYDKWLKVSEMQ